MIQNTANQNLLHPLILLELVLPWTQVDTPAIRIHLRIINFKPIDIKSSQNLEKCIK